MCFVNSFKTPSNDNLQHNKYESLTISLTFFIFNIFDFDRSFDVIPI